jgi:hypothetical protein
VTRVIVMHSASLGVNQACGLSLGHAECISSGTETRASVSIVLGCGAAPQTMLDPSRGTSARPVPTYAVAIGIQDAEDTE